MDRESIEAFVKWLKDDSGGALCIAETDYNGDGPTFSCIDDGWVELLIDDFMKESFRV